MSWLDDISEVIGLPKTSAPAPAGGLADFVRSGNAVPMIQRDPNQPTAIELGKQQLSKLNTQAGEHLAELDAAEAETKSLGKAVGGPKTLALADKVAEGYNPALMGVIKAPGGNWLAGSVEDSLKWLKRNPIVVDPLSETSRNVDLGIRWIKDAKRAGIFDTETAKAYMEAYPSQTRAFSLPDIRAFLRKNAPDHPLLLSPEEYAAKEALSPAQAALNNWVDKQLTRYVKNEMGTPNDPVRALAETGVTHTAFPDQWEAENLAKYRRDAGFPGGGLGKAAPAKGWELAADQAIYPRTAEELLTNFDGMGRIDKTREGMKALEANPGLKKVEPSTPFHSIYPQNASSELGFDHIMDVLREQLATGELTPDKLAKVSMADAVKRTFEYDQKLAKAAAAFRAKAAEGAPVLMQFPGGDKLIQLNKAGQFAAESDAMGHSVRGYEPQQGHADWIKESGNSGSSGYGHGGWEGIKSGRAEVYSLRGPDAQSYATIELKRPTKADILRNDPYLPPTLLGEALKEPQSITQLKGPGNRAIDAAKSEQIKDFLNSREFGSVNVDKLQGVADTKNENSLLDLASQLDDHLPGDKIRLKMQSLKDIIEANNLPRFVSRGDVLKALEGANKEVSSEAKAAIKLWGDRLYLDYDHLPRGKGDLKAVSSDLREYLSDTTGDEAANLGEWFAEGARRGGAVHFTKDLYDELLSSAAKPISAPLKVYKSGSGDIPKGEGRWLSVSTKPGGYTDLGPSVEYTLPKGTLIIDTKGLADPNELIVHSKSLPVAAGALGAAGAASAQTQGGQTMPNANASWLDAISEPVTAPKKADAGTAEDNSYDMSEYAPPANETRLQRFKRLARQSAKEHDTPEGALLMGAGETALQGATGLGSTIAGGLAGLAGAALPGPPGQGAKWSQAIQKAGTYEPKSSAGQLVSELMATPLTLASEFAGKGAPMVASAALNRDLTPNEQAAAQTVGEASIPLGATLAGGGAMMKQAGAPKTRAPVAGEDYSVLRELNPVERERLQRQTKLGIEPTLGSVQRTPEQVRFEQQTAKTPDGAALRQREVENNQAVVKAVEDTDAMRAGRRATENNREVGQTVARALEAKAKDSLSNVGDMYAAAKNAGETKAVVNVRPLENWLSKHKAEAISTPELNSISAKLADLKSASKGKVTIDDLEELYKSAGALGKPGESSGHFMKQVKDQINNITDGAGGDLYRAARASRLRHAFEFEDRSAIAKLIEKKPGSRTDYKTANEDVFSKTVLNSSLTELKDVTNSLLSVDPKKNPQAIQAVRELQAQTIDHLLEKATAGIAEDEHGGALFSPAGYRRAVKEIGQDKLKHLLGDEAVQRLNDILKTSRELKTSPGTVSGSDTFLNLKMEAARVAKEQAAHHLFGSVPIIGTALRPISELMAKRKATKQLQGQVGEALVPARAAPAVTQAIAEQELKRNRQYRLSEMAGVGASGLPAAAAAQQQTEEELNQ